jgi:thiol-disulfide isomerase/thioredoxin
LDLFLNFPYSRIEFIKKYGLLLLFIGIAVFYVLRYKRTPNIQTEEIILRASDGQQVLLSNQLQGNTVIHFYASWCGPCRAEMAEIRNHYASLREKGLHFIFITDDEQEKVEFLQQQMPHEIQFFQIESLKSIGIYSIPATYFYNEKKEMIKKHLGAISWADEKAVHELILQLNQ